MGKVSTGVRFALYSSDDGLFLFERVDGTIYTSKAPGVHVSARTFKSIKKAKRYRNAKLNRSYRPMEIYPDKFDAYGKLKYASIEACAAAGLPRWEPTKS